jgi:hypothetical protein
MTLRLLKIILCTTLAVVLFFFPDIGLIPSALFTGLMAALVIYTGTVVFTSHPFPSDKELFHYVIVVLMTMTFFLLIHQLPNFAGAREVIVVVPIVCSILMIFVLSKVPKMLFRIWIGTDFTLRLALMGSLYSPLSGTNQLVYFCVCTFVAIAIGRMIDGEGNEEKYRLIIGQGVLGTTCVLGFFLFIAFLPGHALPFTPILVLSTVLGMLLTEGMLMLGYRYVGHR